MEQLFITKLSVISEWKASNVVAMKSYHDKERLMFSVLTGTNLYIIEPLDYQWKC